jgi:hypothetical protein
LFGLFVAGCAGKAAVQGKLHFFFSLHRIRLAVAFYRN